MDGKNNSLQGLMLMASHKYARKTFGLSEIKDIHPRQIPLILLLNRADGCSQREIAKKMGIAPPTVNVSIHRMETSGLVRRENDEKDMRTSRIYLTDKGRQIADNLMEQTVRNEKYLERGFSDSELCLFKRFMKQLIENIDSLETK